MRYTKSIDGKMRTTVRIAFRLTTDDVFDALCYYASTFGIDGFNEEKTRDMVVYALKTNVNCECWVDDWNNAKIVEITEAVKKRLDK